MPSQQRASLRAGLLPVDIACVVSNHPDLRALVEWHGIAYHHLPITAATKPAQEAALLALFEESRADCLVLARYMQILSPSLCERLRGRAINIHHSFLPSFKGAKPYTQAHARGVKIICGTDTLGVGVNVPIRSVLFTNFWYLGGAHSNDDITTFTFDLAAKKQLALSDLFCATDPKPVLDPLVRKHVRSIFDTAGSQSVPDYSRYTDGYQAWVLDGDDLVIHMPAGRTGPVHAGMFVAQIPLSELRPQLRDGGCAA